LFIPARHDLVSLIVTRLSSDGDWKRRESVPSFLIRNWPPAFKEWSTEVIAMRFRVATIFPRLTIPTLKETISRGFGNGLLAYVGRTASSDTNRSISTGP